MNLQIRQLLYEGTKIYSIFKLGEFDNPLCILSQQEFDRLKKQIELVELKPLKKKEEIIDKREKIPSSESRGQKTSIIKKQRKKSKFDFVKDNYDLSTEELMELTGLSASSVYQYKCKIRKLQKLKQEMQMTSSKKIYADMDTIPDNVKNSFRKTKIEA